VHSTSTLTATLIHQTQQQRLNVSDRTDDAHLIARVCNAPVSKCSLVSVRHTLLNLSQSLPHHCLWHDGGYGGRRFAAAKNPQARSHGGNEWDQKQVFAGL